MPVQPFYYADGKLKVVFMGSGAWMFVLCWSAGLGQGVSGTNAAKWLETTE